MNLPWKEVPGGHKEKVTFEVGLKDQGDVGSR